MAVIAPIVGAAIGGSIATAINAAWVAGTIGHAIGSAIGATVMSHLFRPKMPGVEGPRMQDVSIQVSTYGAPIPIIWGTCMLAGCVIWSAGIREVATTSRVRGGKGRRRGGQTVTTYSYYGTWAVGLCEGEITCIRRIWLDTDLVYDASNPAAAAANQAFLAKAKIYRGTEDQLPDPTIQAHVGAANAPAYRGLAYIVLNDILLDRYGNRLPSVRVEAVRTDIYYTTEPYYVLGSDGARFGAQLVTARLSEVIARSTDACAFGMSITSSSSLTGPRFPYEDQASMSVTITTGALGGELRSYEGIPELLRMGMTLQDIVLYNTLYHDMQEEQAAFSVSIVSGELV